MRLKIDLNEKHYNGYMVEWNCKDVKDANKPVGINDKGKY